MKNTTSLRKRNSLTEFEDEYREVEVVVVDDGKGGSGKEEENAGGYC